MTLVAIVASLLLERVLGHWQHLRKLPWFVRYREWLFRVIPETWQQGMIGGVVLLAIPVLVILLLQGLLHGHAWGLWQLALSVAVLSYCLGPEAFNERIDAYLQACEAHDRQQAKKIAESLVGDSVPDNMRQQTQTVAAAILYEGNVRIFAVVFWFILLGPAGALLYRCAAFLRLDAASWAEPVSIQAYNKLYGLMDWLPARLLSLTFFLAGSFEDAWQGWRQVNKAEQDFVDSNRSIVINTGCGAMRHQIDEAFDDSDDEPDRDEKYDLYWVSAARALVLRSLVVWLALIAILTMLGPGWLV